MAQEQKTQVDLIAADFATLYKSLQHPVTSHEAFTNEWDRLECERMHYAGASIPKNGFHPHIVKKLLAVAATFTALPPSAAPSAMNFGVMLLFHLYFTQPIDAKRPREEQKERIILDITTAESTLSLHDALPIYLSDEACCDMMGQLEDDGALAIVPQLDNQAIITALVKGVPGVIVDGDDHGDNGDDGTLLLDGGGGGGLDAKLKEYNSMVKGML